MRTLIKKESHIYKMAKENSAVYVYKCEETLIFGTLDCMDWQVNNE